MQQTPQTTNQETPIDEDQPQRIRWPQGRMYAIAFDLDTAALKEHYGSSHENAYREIKDGLAQHGFEPQQGSVYFGNKDVTSVTCVLAVQDLAYRFSWFAEAVRDIRMLRIEEHNDLSVAIPQKV